MGQVSGKLGGLFGNAGDQVNGTGQTVDDLKQIGYSPQDISSLGTKPSFGASLARGALRGGLQGYDNQQNPQRKQNISPFFGGQ